MITCLILVLVSLLIFAAYNTAVLRVFDVPKSLSESFYLWNSKKKHLGFMFTGMMFIMAMALMPAWLELGEVVSSWSSNLNVLAFLACASIGFVGAAPAFRSNKLEGAVHEVAAKIAAAASLAWCLVVCWQIMYVPLTTAGLVAVGGWVTKTWKSASVYWLEMMAFGATFVTVIVELLIQIL